MALVFFERLGQSVLVWFTALGEFGCFVGTVFKTLFTTRLRVEHVISHSKAIGVESAPIVIVTGLFTGLALALQAYVGLHKFSAEGYLGAITALGMIRELGPVLTGLMVTGRAGSAMAAELGIMKITEQIDALQTLGIDPYRYLVVPRLVASCLVLPCLTLFAMLFGIGGGYFFSTKVLVINPEVFNAGIREFIELYDVIGGLIKGTCFGAIMVFIAVYAGYTASEGARGVGRATTRTVVITSMLIFILNYFLSALLFRTGDV